MTQKQAENAINKLFKENDSAELGIFISLLSYHYIQCFDLTKEEFLKSLKNSLNKLESEVE